MSVGAPGGLSALQVRWAGILLGFAMAMTSATQWRIGGGRIGAGEIMLVGWSGVALLRLVVSPHQVPLAWSLPTVGFWGVALSVMCLGWVMAIGLDVWSFVAPLDLLAFLLCATVTIAVVLQKEADHLLWCAAETFVITMIAASTLMLGALALGRSSIWGLTTLYGFRFTGWSLNPNQLALAVSLIPFLALARRRSCRPRWARAFWGIAAGLAIVIGVATLSDALMLGWTVAALLGGRAWILSVFRDPHRSVRMRGIIIFMVPTILTIAGIKVGPGFVNVVRNRVTEQWSEGAQGSDRIVRWVHGIDAATTSPIIGFGPGSYSGRYEPFEGEEVHNSLLDWLTITGLVGVGALVGWVIWAWRHAVQAHRINTAGAGLTLLIFSQFHFILRQPLVWLLVLALAVEGPDTSNPTRAEA